MSAVMPSLPGLADSQLARAVRCLFNAGFDTSEIAQVTVMTEQAVDRLLHNAEILPFPARPHPSEAGDA